MPSTPLEAYLKWEKEHPDKIFLRQPINGVWTTWTWAQAGNEARKLAQGFYSMGLKEKDHVALLSKNCAQWIISDIAMMMAGVVSVPLYPTLSANAIEPILIHSDAKAIIIGKLDDYSSQVKGIPENMLKLGMETYGIKEQYSFEKIIETNEPVSSLYNWSSD